MANYAIGDIQGCFDALQRLLQAIRFDSAHDRLWLTGDLVNRGPDSLETLRFLSCLKPAPIVVLGNHDLHCLACFYGVATLKSSDTLTALMAADDAPVLCTWLQQQALLYHDARLNYTLVHAGLAPQWSLQKAQSLAAEIETLLQGPQCIDFLANMYGNKPNAWSDDLTGWPRARLITNYLTRMRFCDQDGGLTLNEKGAPPLKDSASVAWYDVPGRANASQNILFGHWAALNGRTDRACVFALDTGCVWGGTLTAMRLEDQQRISVHA